MRELIGFVLANPAALRDESLMCVLLNRWIEKIRSIRDAAYLAGLQEGKSQ